MADNVIVRVPEQQFIRGEDGYSPEVTIEDIAHGHSVTITDRDHPTGQSFNVMDGDSAYEQAVAGGYTGTEAQFNEELGSFGELSEQAASSANTAAGAAFRAQNYERHAGDAEDAARAYADIALIRMNSADASAQAAAGSAGDASTAATTATTKAGEASDSATAADGSAKDSEAYAIGKRGGTDVGSTDPAYHNNAKYYAQQAALIVDDVEQVMTPTTIGPTALVTFDASAAGMPLKGLTANIGPVQSGSGVPSPDNVRPITGLTGCKLHHTGVSLIGGDAFIGNTFSKTANGYQLSYNGSSIANRASAFADIRGLPAGRYTIEMLNPTYPQGVEVNIRRSTAGSTVTMGVMINADSATGRRTYNIPENTTSLQLYIIPDTTSLNTSITMSDIVLVREGDASEPYKGNVYNITFPSEAGAVYGGTLDVVNRKLNSYPYYSSYNGETIIGPWISSMDVYTPGATPTLGAQVVDMGGAATSYDLSDVPEITTLFGENNIWANRGDVTVTYGAYLETVKAYADQAADSAAAAEDAQEAAEAVLASIPEDYTELSGDVDELKSAFGEYQTLTATWTVASSKEINGRLDNVSSEDRIITIQAVTSDVYRLAWSIYDSNNTVLKSSAGWRYENPVEIDTSDYRTASCIIIRMQNKSGSGSISVSAADNLTIKKKTTIELMKEDIDNLELPDIVYVDGENGNDDNTGGSWADSFKTITQAIDSGAHSVLIKPGTYDPFTLQYKHNVNLMLDRHYDTFTTGTDEDYKPVIIDGDFGATNTGINVIACDNIILDGFEVRNFTAQGILVRKCTQITIKNTVIHDIRKSDSTGTQHGYNFEYADVDCIDCTAYNIGTNTTGTGARHCDGFNIHYTGDVNLYNCNAYNCEDDGVSHHDASRGIIDGGEWYSNGKAGIASPTYGAKVNIQNAYCHDNKYGLEMISSTVANRGNILVSNCVCKNNTTKDISIQDALPVVLMNCVYDTIEGTNVTEYKV